MGKIAFFIPCLVPGLDDWDSRVVPDRTVCGYRVQERWLELGWSTWFASNYLWSDGLSANELEGA